VERLRRISGGEQQDRPETPAVQPARTNTPAVSAVRPAQADMAVARDRNAFPLDENEHEFKEGF
jgi:hypothetical protein